MPRSQFDQELNKMHVDLDRMCHLVVLAIENCVTAFKEQDYKGSYMNGRYDSVPEPGRYLVSTIDARLQLLGEELMRGKVGAAVAIEPSTGEILMMVS